MNYYEILEVSQSASQSVIKAAYKSLIQRYHPDRNPNNVESAQHAALVIQAYEVLSDIEKRAAYNISLEQVHNSAGGIEDVQSRRVYTKKEAVRESKSQWFVWMLILVIILSGWLILSLSKKKPSPEPEIKQKIGSPEANRQAQDSVNNKLNKMEAVGIDHSDMSNRNQNGSAQDVAARTIPVFITNIAVNIRFPEMRYDNSVKSLTEPVHMLSIPVIGLTVGTFDSEKVIRYFESRKDSINHELEVKLTYIKYEELNKIDGEQYLKRYILNTLADVTGTNRYEDYLAAKVESSGHYGIVEILLPESFSVR